MSIIPGNVATPVLTLLPSTGSAAVAVAPASRSGGGGGGAFGRVRVGGGGSSAWAGGTSSLSGKFRGLGHLTLEFVRRGPPGKKITHLVAGGRGGAFRVWRFFPEKAKQLAPYLEVGGGELTAGSFFYGQGSALLWLLLLTTYVVSHVSSGKKSSPWGHKPVIKSFQRDIIFFRARCVSA